MADEALAKVLMLRKKVPAGSNLVSTSRPDTSRYSDLPVTTETFHDFANVGHVRVTMSQFEQGTNFLQSSVLAEVMSRDDRIASTLNTRKLGLFGSPRSVHPAGDKRRAQTVANALSLGWNRMFPPSQLQQLWWWGTYFGIGVGELVWARDSRSWTPRLKVWHPQFLYWRWDTRSFWIITQDAGAVEVKEGDGKWVIYSPNGYYRGWMGGLIRQLAIPWLIRQWAYRDWARHSEVNGLGIKLVDVPSMASQEDKDTFFSSLAKLGSESLLMLPKDEEGNGFDFKYAQADANTWEGFEKLITKAEDSIAITVLGQSQTTQIQKDAGSRASAKEHKGVLIDYRRADAQSFSESIRDQALLPWTLYNFGDPDLTPTAEWNVEPEEDKKTSADALNILATALKTLKDAEVSEVDVRLVLEQAGVPLLTGESPTTASPATNLRLLKASKPKEPRRVAVIAVFNGRREMLWGRRRDNGLWTTPGGHLEVDEQPEAAAKRELYEEAGLEPDSLTFIAQALGGKDGDVEVSGYVALCRGTPTTVHDPDDEVEEWIWVNVANGIPLAMVKELYVPLEANVLVRALNLQPQSAALVAARAQVEQRVSQAQDFVDATVLAGVEAARPLVELDVKAVLEEVQAAESPEDLRARLTHRFSQLDASKLRVVFAKARLLARLAGRNRVLEET